MESRFAKCRKVINFVDRSINSCCILTNFEAGWLMGKQIYFLQRSKQIEAPYLPNFETNSLPRRVSPSVPGAGMSLAAATALKGKAIRDAVALLTQAFGRHDLRERFTSL